VIAEDGESVHSGTWRPVDDEGSRSQRRVESRPTPCVEILERNRRDWCRLFTVEQPAHAWLADAASR
jgi:hypothetical protein